MSIDKTSSESEPQPHKEPSCINENILMNILYDNYDLNEQFHKEAREMIFSFAVAHYGEKLTLDEWLNKYYS